MQIDIWCWWKCGVCISIFSVCVAYGFQYLVLVLVSDMQIDIWCLWKCRMGYLMLVLVSVMDVTIWIWKSIFGIGVSVGYGNQYLVLVFVSEVDLNI